MRRHASHPIYTQARSISPKENILVFDKPSYREIVYRLEGKLPVSRTNPRRPHPILQSQRQRSHQVTTPKINKTVEFEIIVEELLLYYLFSNSKGGSDAVLPMRSLHPAQPDMSHVSEFATCLKSGCIPLLRRSSARDSQIRSLFDATFPCIS